jgi:hypothetical protein
MADDVGGCLTAGTHSSIVLETFMADGDDSNSVDSLEESHSSSCLDRAENLE